MASSMDPTGPLLFVTTAAASVALTYLPKRNGEGEGSGGVTGGAVRRMGGSAVGSLLCLGDSYTIGEGLASADTFPFLLRSFLMEKSLRSNEELEVKVVAKTGWTTNELAEAIDAEKCSFKTQYDLVTLLIGVNNQYRGSEKGYDLGRYQAEFPPLLETAITFAGMDSSKVRVVSIPDWGLTTFGQKSGRDSALTSKELDEYNEFASELCKTKLVEFIDITTLSREVGPNPAYLVEDGLHYSKKFNEGIVEKLAATLTT